MKTWTWHWQQVKPTKGTTERWYIASLQLEPTPEGKSADLRMFLKQWCLTAAKPGSWCMQQMKYGEKAPGRWDPWKPFNLIQVSQLDWEGYFSAWADANAILERFTAITEDRAGTAA